MRQKQWIIGASGYVGKQILMAASEQTAPSKLVLFGYQNIPYEQFERYNTITADIKIFDFEWYDRFPPEYIFFSARIAGGTPKKRRKAGEQGRKANEKFLNNLKNKGYNKDIIFVSGSLNYGNQPQGKMVNEEASLSPTGYAKYYGIAEKPFLEAQEIRVKMARPAWILGPDSWFKVFFWQWAKNNGAVPYFGSGEQQMSILSVKDCGRMIYRLKDYDIKTQNLYAYPPISQKQFSEIIADVMQLETVQVSEKVIAEKYDYDTAEALCSNIPLTTVNPGFFEGFTPEFSTIRELVEGTLNILNQ